MIYLDHNATTPLAPPVLDAMMPFLTDRFGNAASRHHALGCDSATAVETARGRAASVIGADPREIVWTSGATESRAATTTPAERVGAPVARFPTRGSLPPVVGGSASAFNVSRPARRSLHVAARMVADRPRQPFFVGVLRPVSLPPSSAPTATGWSDSCRAGFAPEKRRLHGAPRHRCGMSVRAVPRCSAGKSEQTAPAPAPAMYLGLGRYRRARCDPLKS